MAALLRFVAFFAALVAVLLLVVLPLAATPFLTQVVRSCCFRGVAAEACRSFGQRHRTRGS